MKFDRWVNRYLLPLLLLFLVVSLYFEFGSVETVDLDRFSQDSVRDQSRPQIDSVQEAKTTAPKFDTLVSGDNLTGILFDSLEALVDHQSEAGFVKVGTFEGGWPARVIEVQSDRDQISFVRQNGTRHTYQKFDGYDMRMIRLKKGERETLIIFRSRNKR